LTGNKEKANEKGVKPENPQQSKASIFNFKSFLNMTTKQIINSWKDAENTLSTNNPAGNANVDSDILNRVLGGNDGFLITGCIPDWFPAYMVIDLNDLVPIDNGSCPYWDWQELG
jgi:hypothetical protein